MKTKIKSLASALFAWLMVLVFLLPSSGWAKAGRESGRSVSPMTVGESRKSNTVISRRKGPSSNESSYESLSPEEKAKLQDRSKKWENLPPEKRRELERRMNQWKALPPDQKDLMKKRHQQWRDLPPGEQDEIRKKLNRWDSLSPQEQDEIRKKFKRP